MDGNQGSWGRGVGICGICIRSTHCSSNAIWWFLIGREIKIGMGGGSGTDRYRIRLLCNGCGGLRRAMNFIDSVCIGGGKAGRHLNNFITNNKHYLKPLRT